MMYLVSRLSDQNGSGISPPRHAFLLLLWHPSLAFWGWPYSLFVVFSNVLHRFFLALLLPFLKVPCLGRQALLELALPALLVLESAITIWVSFGGQRT